MISFVEQYLQIVILLKCIVIYFSTITSLNAKDDYRIIEDKPLHQRFYKFSA